MDEDDYGGDDGYDEGLEIRPEELELLKKKKRWRDKEVEIRAKYEEEKAKKKKKVGATSKEKVENIFTSHAATGILTTEMINIMQNVKQLGFSAKPIDDNIYEWEVRLFDLKPDSDIAKDLAKLQAKYGYDYISFSMSFKLDLYPFYPPLVKLVRHCDFSYNDSVVVHAHLLQIIDTDSPSIQGLHDGKNHKHGDAQAG
jgi:baculoviral IAP repeat-containing protein 6